MAAGHGHGALMTGTYRHEAFLYRGEDEFIDVARTFVRDAIDAAEPVMLAISAAKGERLRSELRDELVGHDDVLFVDINEIGRNPARIIPAWRQFLQTHHGDGRGARGIGEPVWAGRKEAELREAQRHEALLNVAFRGVRDFWLMCPYDVGALTSEVIDEAYRSHPYAFEGGLHSASPLHEPGTVIPSHLDTPLPDPPSSPRRLLFGAGALSDVRRAVDTWATGSGLRAPRSDLLVLAVNELATNSIEHGGGQGELLMWQDEGDLVAEVRDAGHITEPLVGRFLPDQQQGGGRGVWLVNQVCDLVQIRTTPGRTVVRVHVSL
jgi:anti-sigma regulatory factor (Ser/Thr protein kinase)